MGKWRLREMEWLASIHPAPSFLTGQCTYSFCRYVCVNPQTSQKEKAATAFGGNTAISYLLHIPSHPLFTTIFTPYFFFFCQTHVSTSKIQGHLNKNDGLDVLTKLTRATKPTTKKKHFFILNTETSFLSLRHTCNSNVCISSEREMNGENCFTGPWFAYICVTVWMGVVLLLNIRQSTITDNWDFTGMFKKWWVNTNSPS